MVISNVPRTMRGMLFMDKIAIFFDRQNKHLLNWDANPSEDVLIRDFLGFLEIKA